MFFSGAYLDITNSSLACIILPPAKMFYINLQSLIKSMGILVQRPEGNRKPKKLIHCK